MTDLNHVFLIGRLTKTLGDDERSFGYIGNGQAKATISIASNTTKKVNDEWKDDTNYFNITIWGKQAESLKPFLIKGTQVSIDGHLKQNKWEKDGKTHYDLAIIADHVQLLQKPNNTSNTKSNSQSNRQQQQTQNYEAENGDEFPEDIPF